MKDKEKQRELIVEIMKADEQSGLYDEPRVKLYTEEQLREAFFEGVNYPKNITPASMGFVEQYVAKKINSLTPIELPSDEEIEEASPIVNINAHDYYFGHKDGFIEGAKWMRDKLTNTKDK